MHAPSKGLYGLLFAEFWERFGYFALLSLLAVYLNESLHYSQGRASATVGTVAALAYLTPLLGGWIADRVLGNRRTLFLGAVFLAAGYVTLGGSSVIMIYGGILLVSLGSGLFKPSITTCIGALGDPADEPRRQAVFRAFYLCVNLAAATAPIAVGIAKSSLGWPAAFAGCALSMFVCISALVWTRNTILERPPVDHRSSVRASSAGSVAALAALCLPAIAFFAVYSQSLGALIFWARDRVDLTLGGRLTTPLAPATTCAAIPILAVALSPAIDPLRRRLYRTRVVQAAAGELKLALLLASLSVLVLIIPETTSNGYSRFSATWLLTSYLLATVSELLIVPLCLSLIELIAPPHRRATYTGIWYLAVAAGSQLGGDMGRLWGAVEAVHYFLLVSLIPLVAYVVLCVLSPRLDRRLRFG